MPIRTEVDLVEARRAGRALAERQGFTSSEAALVATAISEVARNIVSYAGTGQLELELVEERGRVGVRVVASDQGPGIPDVDLAMRDGYSTGGGLGLGLPGSRRLMDEFELNSTVGQGTTVRMTKWKR